jgi:hypothetical protein
MTKHRSHNAAFKRQVAEEFVGGETLHALHPQGFLTTERRMSRTLDRLARTPSARTTLLNDATAR